MHNWARRQEIETSQSIVRIPTPRGSEDDLNSGLASVDVEIRCNRMLRHRLRLRLHLIVAAPRSSPPGEGSRNDAPIVAAEVARPGHFSQVRVRFAGWYGHSPPPTNHVCKGWPVHKVCQHARPDKICGRAAAGACFRSTCVGAATVVVGRLCYVNILTRLNGRWKSATHGFSSTRRDGVPATSHAGHLMNASTQFTGAVACCAFCIKPLPIVDGELRPWRSASGRFFCNEFCADDAEEARFQSYHRADRRATDLPL
jgi:hypothetical protein